MADSGIAFRSQAMTSEIQARADAYKVEGERILGQAIGSMPQAFAQGQQHQMKMAMAESEMATEEMRRAEIQQKMLMVSQLRTLDVERVNRDMAEHQLSVEKWKFEEAKKNSQSQGLDADQLLKLSWADYLPSGAFRSGAGGRVESVATPEQIKEAQAAWLADKEKDRQSKGRIDPRLAFKAGNIKGELNVLLRKDFQTEESEKRIKELRMELADLNEMAGLPAGSFEMEGTDMGQSPQGVVQPQPPGQNTQLATPPDGYELVSRTYATPFAQQPTTAKAGGVDVMVQHLAQDPEFVKTFDNPKWQPFGGNEQVAGIVIRKIAMLVKDLTDRGMSLGLAKQRAIEAFDKDPEVMGELLDELLPNTKEGRAQRDLYLSYYGYKPRERRKTPMTMKQLLDSKLDSPR